MGFYLSSVLPEETPLSFGGAQDVGIDCLLDQSQGQMASALQAVLMAGKGPFCPQNCTGRGYDELSEEAVLCVPSTSFFCPHVGSVVLQFPCLSLIFVETLIHKSISS